MRYAYVLASISFRRPPSPSSKGSRMPTAGAEAWCDAVGALPRPGLVRAAVRRTDTAEDAREHDDGLLLRLLAHDAQEDGREKVGVHARARRPRVPPAQRGARRSAAVSARPDGNGGGGGWRRRRGVESLCETRSGGEVGAAGAAGVRVCVCVGGGRPGRAAGQCWRAARVQGVWLRAA